jgi:predicted transcriptional regulator
MAKSFRLDPELERRLEEAATRDGVSASVFIRLAVQERCDIVLGRSLLDALGDTVGAVESGKMDSRKTGRAFADLVVDKHRRKRS